MENVLEIAVWVAAGLLVLLLLCLGLVIAIDHSGDEASGPLRQSRRGRGSAFWFGIMMCSLAAICAGPLLWDPNYRPTWRRVYVERWQVWTASAMYAFLGLWLLILAARHHEEPKAEKRDESNPDDFASTPDEDGL